MHPTLAGGARQIARQSSVVALMGGRRASIASLHRRAEYAQAMDAVRATWMQVRALQLVLRSDPERFFECRVAAVEEGLTDRFATLEWQAAVIACRAVQGPWVLYW